MRALKFELPKTAELCTNLDVEGMLFYKNQKNGFHVAVCHYTADPKKRSEEWYKQATGNMREDQRKREYEIDFTSRAGAKAFPYLEQFEDIYRIDDIDLDKIPEHWRIFAGLDFGATNPTAIGLFGVTEKNQIICFFEFYKPSHFREIARVLKGKHEKYPFPSSLAKRIEAVVADPSIWKGDQHEPMREEMTSIADLIKGEGIHNLEKGENARLAGLERIKELLNYDSEKDVVPKPDLLFCRRIHYGWKEFTNLVLEEVPPERIEEKNLMEDVKKKDDHFFDMCRYVSMRVKRGIAPRIQGPKGMFILDEVEKEMDRSGEDELGFY